MLSPLTLALAAGLLAPDSAAAPNRFAGFETLVLANGLKVWYKHLPGAQTVSLSLTVPVGSDHDPVGQEQLAHFLEHAQFGDHRGRTETEIKRAMEDRGGVRNAFTAWDRTVYWVRIGREHGLLALEWLARLVERHDLPPEVVERQRQPVAIEVGARPRELLDWIGAVYVAPPWLRLHDFWEREFGLRTRWSRDYDPYRSLQRIDAADLYGFYDTWYVPGVMTLTVIGDLDRAAALALIDTTFGALPPSPPPTVTFPLATRTGPRRRYAWDFRPDVSYDRRYRAPDLSGNDALGLEFLTRFLQRRLEERLRFGERKAVYGIFAGLQQRGAAAHLQIAGRIRTAEYAYARGVIDEEIAALRDGTLSDDAFREGRAAVAAELRVQTANPEDLEAWAVNRFYLRDRHRDFPDVVAAFETITQAELTALAQTYLAPDREVRQVVAPIPISQGATVLVLGLVVLVTVAGLRQRLLTPADMTRIRYVARLHVPGLYRALVFAGFGLLVAVGLRLLVQLFLVLGDRYVTAVNSFVVQGLAGALMLAATVAFVHLAFAAFPRKLLVFDDHVRIKYLTHRSVVLRPEDVADIGLRRFRDVWLSRGILRCAPLALGLFAPAIHLVRRDGRSWFFQTRDRTETLAVLERFRAGGPHGRTPLEASPGPVKLDGREG